MTEKDQNEKDRLVPPRVALRDPLALGFEAHRGLLLFKLRLHESAGRRKDKADRPQRVRALSIAAAKRRRSASAATITSGEPSISKSQSGSAK